MGAIKPRNYTTHTLYLAHLFRALSNPLRIEILHFLMKNDEVRNVDIVKRFGIAKNTCKVHLQFLKDAALIDIDYRQQCYFIRLKDEALDQLHLALNFLEIERKNVVPFPSSV